MTKPAQSKLCAGCGKSRQGAIPAGSAGTSGAIGEVELQVLGAEPAAGTAPGCSGMGHSTAPPHSPGHAAELGGAECKGLAAASGPAAPGEYFIFSVQ